MDIFDISNIKIKSVVKVDNKSTGFKFIQYGKKHEYFQLIYVLSGSAEVVFNDTIIHNKPGTIVFLPSGNCTNYQAKILEDEECIAIFFSADFESIPKADFQNFVKSPKISLLFEKIQHLWVRKETGYYNKCISIFYSVLAEMEIYTSKYITKDKADKIKNAINYIHQHYTDCNFEYNKLHSLCNISYTYFKKLFIENFSATPSEYVKKLKIKRACELLLTKQFTVSDVAQNCGFTDLCYFSKVFKNETGVSPSTFYKKTHPDL